MKIFSKISLYFVIIIIAAVLIQQSVCPIYDYPVPTSFSGDKFFNPYSDIVGKKKVKANFHAHTRAWWGLTDGKNNLPDELVKRYKFLDYDISGISNYMNINTLQQFDKFYIPEYEHGYGIKKNHQICIGTNKVLWNDYFFFQILNNKQYILKELEPLCKIVYIAHPNLRNAYSIEDMQNLTDYDAIEVANHNFGKATNLWDAALSTGHLVFGTGGDDCHNYNNFHEYGGAFNIIYCDSLTPSDVCRSLKSGKSIAAEQDASTLLLKKVKAMELPALLNFDVNYGKITLNLDKPAIEIDFIGQNGNIRQKDFGNKQDTFNFAQNDTYIRAEILFPDSTMFYLNPVVRYSGEKPQILTASIDYTNTWLLRIISGIIFIGIILTIKLFKGRKNKLAKS